MSDGKEARFATHLTLQYNLGNQQAEVGLYVIKRTQAYLKKIAQAHADCAIALDKATKNEATKVTALQKDGMKGHVGAVVQMQAVFTSVTNKHRDFAAKVTKDVITPLQTFLDAGEKKRLETSKKEVRVTGNLTKLYTKMKDRRKLATKEWEAVQQLKSKFSPDDLITPKGQKLDKDIKKQVEKTKKAFQDYEHCVEESHAAAQKYYSSEMPEVMAELEALEQERLVILKQSLLTFAKYYSEWDRPTSPGDVYNEVITALDIKHDIQKCIQEKVAEVGMPTGPPELPPPLPCHSNDFDNDSWKNPKAPNNPKFTGAGVTGGGGGGPSLSSSVSSSSMAHADLSASQSQSNHSSSTKVGPPPAPHSSAETKGEPTEVVTDDAGPQQYCKGVYDYQTDHSDDLHFKTGSVIRLLTPNVDFSSHDPNNPVWLLGELVTDPDRSGSFPSNYVEACDANGGKI